MTADDMANYHEHMSTWLCGKLDRVGGLLYADLERAIEEHVESARYWREKAKPMDELQRLGQEYDNERV